MTIFAEANVDVDLRMLRSFRVLRPLKLVSRIPSKQQITDYKGRSVAYLSRSCFDKSKFIEKKCASRSVKAVIS
jgi:hypothetical protein